MEQYSNRVMEKLNMLSSENTSRFLFGMGSRLLFYPTIVYNVTKLKLDTEFRWWDNMDELIYLGAVPLPSDIHFFKSYGIKTVLTLCESYETFIHPLKYTENGINHFSMPSCDYAFTLSDEHIEKAISYIHENVNANNAIYIHCKSGKSRSAFVMICYLMKYRKLNPSEAFEFVHSKRPCIILNNSQNDSISKFYEKLIMDASSKAKTSSQSIFVNYLPKVDRIVNSNSNSVFANHSQKEDKIVNSNSNLNSSAIFHLPSISNTISFAENGLKLLKTFLPHDSWMKENNVLNITEKFMADFLWNEGSEGNEGRKGKENENDNLNAITFEKGGNDDGSMVNDENDHENDYENDKDNSFGNDNVGINGYNTVGDDVDDCDDDRACDKDDVVVVTEVMNGENKGDGNDDNDNDDYDVNFGDFEILSESDLIVVKENEMEAQKGKEMVKKMEMKGTEYLSSVRKKTKDAMEYTLEKRKSISPNFVNSYSWMRTNLKNVWTKKFAKLDLNFKGISKSQHDEKAYAKRLYDDHDNYNNSSNNDGNCNNDYGDDEVLPPIVRSRVIFR